MVDQYSKRVNAVQRWTLVIGIAMIGLLDLAFSTYINHQDLMRPPSGLQVEVKDTGSDRRVSLPISTLNEPDEFSTISSPISKSNIWDHTSKPVRIFEDHRIPRVPARSPQTALAKWSLPPASCRTVSYSLINDSYVVQVTDELGCLTTTLSKN